MQYTASSIHFLYAAYAAMILGNVAYAIFVVTRWLKVNKK